MGKGEATKEFIIEKAAPIFNKNGFAGASLSELMAATGLKKGGIYNHFKNKDEIILEAFNFAIRAFNRSIYLAYKNENSFKDKINAIIDFYESYPLNPVIEGGCPIVNTAVDSDNTNPVLKERVREVLEKWIENLTFLIKKGQQKGELNNQADAYKSAVFIITSMQGGVVISRSFEKNSYMEILAEQIRHYVNENLFS